MQVYNSRNCYADSKQLLLNVEDQELLVVDCTPGAKSATYDCLVLSLLFADETSFHFYRSLRVN